MALISEIADEFFVACETGKGWDGCKAYCRPNATFEAQAEPLADIKTMQQYCDWMKDFLSIVPDGTYELKAFATDDMRRRVVAFATFQGTHTGPGGPVPPTGKKVSSDYVYVMHFDDDKLNHMTKIWHAGLAVKSLGWA